MLLSKSVEVGLGGKNAKYYENLGYHIPRHKSTNGLMQVAMNTKITVDIKDLSKGSEAEVQVQCDGINCNKILSIPYKNYINHKREDDKYYCKKCSSKLFGAKKLTNTLLKKNGKSFYDWCIENNRQDILNRWDYELNDKKPNEITYKTKKKYYLKCLRGLHNSELKNIGSLTSNQGCYIDCKKCNSFAQFLIDTYGENALSDYWDEELNFNINPWNITKSAHKSSVWIKCNENTNHKSYVVKCDNFSKYKGSRCPICNQSKGEKIINEYLNCNNIDYIPQKTFEGLLGLGGGNLSYDFYLPKLNILIEYQGEYHDGNTRNQTEKDIKRQQEHDRRKKQYAIDHDIKLIEIWYWDFDNVEKILEKELLI